MFNFHHCGQNSAMTQNRIHCKNQTDIDFCKKEKKKESILDRSEQNTGCVFQNGSNYF